MKWKIIQNVFFDLQINNLYIEKSSSSIYCGSVMYTFTQNLSQNINFLSDDGLILLFKPTEGMYTLIYQGEICVNLYCMVVYC